MTAWTLRFRFLSRASDSAPTAQCPQVSVRRLTSVLSSFGRHHLQGWVVAVLQNLDSPTTTASGETSPTRSLSER
jgi:hypothetical protein